jgi:N-methylhydantoinase A
MADAIRLISVRRGYDPRDFVLVCFGGAGPLHGAELARELSIPAVLVPPNPGTTSALGCLLVDVRHDFFTLLLGTVDDIDPADVEREFAALEEQARERMRVEACRRTVSSCSARSTCATPASGGRSRCRSTGR